MTSDEEKRLQGCIVALLLVVSYALLWALVGPANAAAAGVGLIIVIEVLRV